MNGAPRRAAGRRRAPSPERWRRWRRAMRRAAASRACVRVAIVGQHGAPGADERVRRRLERHDELQVADASPRRRATGTRTRRARRAPRRRHSTARLDDAHHATASTTHGSTTTTWRPGHHQPCIVSATNVAFSQPATNGATSTGQRGGRRTTRYANAGIASRKTGFHATRPKSRSTSNPTRRIARLGVVRIAADDRQSRRRRSGRRSRTRSSRRTRPGGRATYSTRGDREPAANQSTARRSPARHHIHVASTASTAATGAYFTDSHGSATTHTAASRSARRNAIGRAWPGERGDRDRDRRARPGAPDTPACRTTRAARRRRTRAPRRPRASRGTPNRTTAIHTSSAASTPGERRERELGTDPAADQHRDREERGQQRVVRADELSVRPGPPPGTAGSHAWNVAVAVVAALVADVEVDVLAEADRGHHVLRLVRGEATAVGRGRAQHGATHAVTPTAISASSHQLTRGVVGARHRRRSRAHDAPRRPAGRIVSR